ncbi:MAG: hypothetical protein C7B46_17165 [Sulfobacillus benefaciens]|uniref:Uncharacterized protein n=1 Tax=Sulfobacillus benefaciens TaxID=453960 RepID=A0A2T2X9U2_9FIRM|nr:MAG: hypothetical protein C7B46_17165 [Sulfobacillus benefaciens]
MSWVIGQLSHLAQQIINVFLTVLSFFMLRIDQQVFNTIIEPLLAHTIFQPYTLNHHFIVGRVAWQVFWVMSVLSGGVALVSLLYGIASRLFFILGGQKSWAELAEGLVVWMAVLVGAWSFLNILLSVANTATGMFLQGIKATLKTVFDNPQMSHGVGVVTATTSLFTVIFWPLTGMLLAALVIWAIGVWLVRQVDLVIYAGLLPLMAALGISGNKTPFKWVWSEAMGAVFSQLAMAVVLYIGCLFLVAGDPAHASIWQQFEEMGLALTTFMMAARAPKMLANITGHQYAGSGHILAGMATGYLAGRGLMAAAKMTPGGQAISQMAAGQTQKARETVQNWSSRKSVGEMVGQSKLGQAMQAAGQSVRSRASQAWQGSSLQQAMQATTGGAMAALGIVPTGSSARTAMKATMDQHPTLKSAAAVGGQAASIAYRAGGAALKPLRTAASLTYQPLSTLGHMASQGTAVSHEAGPAGTTAKSEAATIYTAHHGVQAAALQYFGKDTPDNERIAALGTLINAQITPNPAGSKEPYAIQFHDNAPQATLFQAAKRASDKQLQNFASTRPDGTRDYVMAPPPRPTKSAAQ